MDFFANDGKQVEVVVGGASYPRHTIKTHFIEPNESYLGLIERYVLPHFERGDVLFSASKIVSIASGNVIDPDSLKVGRLAKWLSSKVDADPVKGAGVGVPLKMQYAIDTVGVPRILLGAAAAVIGKVIFRRKGWFYVVTGPKVVGIDGLGDDYGNPDEFHRQGIPLPDNAQELCDEVLVKLGVPLVITDTNDFGGSLLGASKSLLALKTKAELNEFIRDNPYGQGHQQTPFVIVKGATA
ncbi:coenzyme F420-0:L-glutamate ligase [Gryllotalpicola protaetiae]|uniref:F420-0--gamma-glutamyl ligase n=1 Tax=Gryllotalpicola protaetiae TaxID=2419771 RepID=A0A387BV88_9MICO|nr:coenzyme F420-0:L-glutamate ligase [Gryllotalpicola protaetiae]AYG05016.1 F420-0--gamma-glutamyl ligase [Gryllotalpicola protaetiae]